MDERQFELPLYTTRRSGRAKRVTLRIAPGAGFEVVVPERYDERRIPEVIAEHRLWIDRRTRQLRRKAEGATALDRTPLPQTIHLTACHERWLVQYRHATGAAPRLTQIGERTLRLRIDLHDLHRAQACLDRWCRRRAATFLPERLHLLAAQSGLRFAGVLVRGQKRRWGSCGRDGQIRLNYKLILLPPELADYVLLHELCHTVQLDHSREFWKLLQSHLPEALQLDKALNDAWRLLPAWLEGR